MIISDSLLVNKLDQIQQTKINHRKPTKPLNPRKICAAFFCHTCHFSTDICVFLFIECNINEIV